VLQRYGSTRDLLSNLTRVARKVAFDFQSNTPGDFVMHEKKQVGTMFSCFVKFRRTTIISCRQKLTEIKQ
jgi:hypothetical protein